MHPDERTDDAPRAMRAPTPAPERELGDSLDELRRARTMVVETVEELSKRLVPLLRETTEGCDGADVPSRGYGSPVARTIAREAADLDDLRLRVQDVLDRLEV